MSIGSRYKITNINYDNKFSKTLIDMGFTKDKCFKVIGTDPLNEYLRTPVTLVMGKQTHMLCK